MGRTDKHLERCSSQEDFKPMTLKNYKDLDFQTWFLDLQTTEINRLINAASINSIQFDSVNPAEVFALPPKRVEGEGQQRKSFYQTYYEVYMNNAIRVVSQNNFLHSNLDSRENIESSNPGQRHQVLKG